MYYIQKTPIMLLKIFPQMHHSSPSNYIRYILYQAKLNKLVGDPIIAVFIYFEDMTVAV